MCEEWKSDWLGRVKHEARILQLLKEPSVPVLDRQKHFEYTSVKILRPNVAKMKEKGV